jgi:hypothetical protein
MASSIFDDKAHKPHDDEVDAALGRTAPLWHRIIEAVADKWSPLKVEWTYSGKPYGWSLRLKQKDRAIVYLTPCARYFRAGFALGEKAVALARASGLPAELLSMIDAAPRYVEGRGVRLEVRRKADVEAVLQLAAVKMAKLR